MLHLIPQPKTLVTLPGFLKKRAMRPLRDELDPRVAAAFAALPKDHHGAIPEFFVGTGTGERYELWIGTMTVRIVADGPAGAFYAIQTLQQLLAQPEVPCLYIEDEPDFAYRGFYQDVSRGKIPTVETVKQLIDRMASFKLNSLQLYVEHTYEFEECKDLNAVTGYYTAEELQELDRYCQERFIEFIPSLSTFGHMYEILQQPEFHSLRCLKDYEEVPNFWGARMGHHTIDPTDPRSIELVKHLIDQYAPNFTSEWFNICCDETFDLHVFEQQGMDPGRLYVDFVKQIIAHLQQKGKKVMMWADILLQHPEVIAELPKDVCFLNWSYDADPPEAQFEKLASLNRTQIVCPGTTTWNRLCEMVDRETPNICKTLDYGRKHGAVGVLNTNWGDWGNPCSLELAMYGMVLGAAKSWTADTQPNDAFCDALNALVYKNDQGVNLLKQLSRIHDGIDWKGLCRNYTMRSRGTEQALSPVVRKGSLAEIQQACAAFRSLAADNPYLVEMQVAAEGLCIMAELSVKMAGEPVQRTTDTEAWLRCYSQLWQKKNKPSELHRIEEMFRFCEQAT